MTQTADEPLHDRGIVSVNARGGTKHTHLARGVFSLLVGAIIITGVLFSVNTWKANRKAETVKEEAAAKAENAPARVGPRRVFDSDPIPTGRTATESRKSGLEGLSSRVVVPGVELGPGEGGEPIPLAGHPDGPRGTRTPTAGSTSRFGGEAILASGPTPAAPRASHGSEREATMSLMRDVISATRQSHSQEGPSTAAAPLFTEAATSGSSFTPSEGAHDSKLMAQAGSSSMPSSIPTISGVGMPPPPGPAASGAGPIGGLLTPSDTPKVQAGLIGDRHLILPKGRSIDCGLTVRVVNEVSGMATCLLTSDVYSDNGRVVLLERGSEAVGEYTATMAQGQRRLFLLWSRVKTPTGVVINLNSPAADELGTAGLAGAVDNHWVDRLGAAFLLSIVQDAIGFATASAAGGGAQGQLSIFQNSATTGNRMAELVLQSTINIKPTLYKNQGDRAAIFVARDLDFSTVYALRSN